MEIRPRLQSLWPSTEVPSARHWKQPENSRKRCQGLQVKQPKNSRNSRKTAGFRFFLAVFSAVLPALCSGPTRHRFLAAFLLFSMSGTWHPCRWPQRLQGHGPRVCICAHFPLEENPERQEEWATKKTANPDRADKTDESREKDLPCLLSRQFLRIFFRIWLEILYWKRAGNFGENFSCLRFLGNKVRKLLKNFRENSD